MKILVTGFSRAACTRNFHKTSQIGLCTAHFSFVECLESMGHEVDQRPVEIGEDLSVYDKVVVFLMHISPYNTYMYSALWAISQREDALFAIEDWQSPKNINTWKKDVDKILDSITNDYYVNNVVKEKTIKPEWRDLFKTALTRISQEDTNIILPAHLGGDFKMLFSDWNPDKVHSWFPPPFTLHRKPRTTLFDEGKEKIFNFAGLIQSETERWFKKVTDGATWEIKQYGSKNKKQVRLSEEDMVTTFSEQWGILMAGYWHAGSGWWRARPQQVADCDSILICDDKEGSVFGKPYEGLTCRMLEGMTEGQLEGLANEQKIAYYDSQPMKKEITIKQIEDYING